MKTFIPIIAMALLSCTYAQTDAENAILVGGPCEGCEAVFEYGDRKLNAVDTISGFEEFSDDRLKVTGTIYEADGKTPAADVVLYLYHTNPEGKYPTRGNETGWERRHGYLRGWIRTGDEGAYTFHTSRPGTYSSNPAHIHATILEPNGKYYYIADYLFTDDRFFNDSANSKRGGSGVMTPEKDSSGVFTVRRDIILGLNVPGY